MTDRAADAADLLASLSTRGKTIVRLPDGLRPQDEEEAIAIQRAFVARHGSCGWKVGPHPSRSGWCASPLRGKLITSPATLPTTDATSMQVEVEIALVLGSDLPATTSATDARAAIAGAHLAFELFRSSYADRNAQDVPSLLADNLSNAGIVLGSGRPLVAADTPGTLQVMLHHDGEQLAATDKGATLETILDALCWLSAYAEQLGAPLKRGDAILTGARLGPLPVSKPGAYRATSALGEVVLRVG